MHDAEIEATFVQRPNIEKDLLFSSSTTCILTASILVSSVVIVSLSLEIIFSSLMEKGAKGGITSNAFLCV